MQLTGARVVEMEQLGDGSVVIRPVRSILDLAGQLHAAGPLLSVKKEQRRSHAAMADRSRIDQSDE
jgi:hypothetical protein